MATTSIFPTGTIDSQDFVFRQDIETPLSINQIESNLTFNYNLSMASTSGSSGTIYTSETSVFESDESEGKPVIIPEPGGFLYYRKSWNGTDRIILKKKINI